jgi:SAM-dependent methyltransferase
VNAATRELIHDEAELLRRLVPLEGARLVELGCGKAELARRLLERALVASVTALEVDQVQHAANLAAPHPPAMTFLAGGADDIPLPDAGFDVAIMLKSLHHVPAARMDRALSEVRRVLRPGGMLYVSEPVFAGEFNEIVRLFHDERVVREQAYAALHRAASSGVLEMVEERLFDTPLAFRDFGEFFDRIVRVTHSDIALAGDELAEVRRRFECHMGPAGARFVRPMRVNVLRRPA